jgi:hypothetical protein
MWGTGASSTQCEGGAPASDWLEWERQGHVSPSGDGNGFGFDVSFGLIDRHRSARPSAQVLAAEARP